MMDELRVQIKRAFERELGNQPVPDDLRRQIVLGAARDRRERPGERRSRLLVSLAALAFFAIGVALFFGLGVSRQSTGPGALVPAVSTPSQTPTPSVSPDSCKPKPPMGCMTVSPTAGPVGTIVTVEGVDCRNPGQSTYIVFEGQGPTIETGTEGAVEIRDVPTDSRGHFRISFTIPANLHPIQQKGGGPVRPGTYDFLSKPPACMAPFTVTAS